MVWGTRSVKQGVDVEMAMVEILFLAHLGGREIGLEAKKDPDLNKVNASWSL